MGKLIINSYAEFEQYVGKELGVSEYVLLDQERINLFADATLDHQWKVRSRVPLPMDTSPCRCCRICGTKSLR